MKQKRIRLWSITFTFLLFFVIASTNLNIAYAATTKPGKPTLVSVENKTAGITVKWKMSSNAKGYYVYRKTETTSFKKIATIKNKNTVSYTDKKVKSKTGITYIYTVRAYNGKVLSKYDSTGLKITREIPASIKLNESSVTIKVGSTLTLKATVTGASKKVTWTSSNTIVATVKNGKVTPKNVGITTITAKANGKTAECKVTVLNPANTDDYKSLYKELLSKKLLPDGQDSVYTPEYYYMLQAGYDVPVLITEGNNTLFVYIITDKEAIMVGVIPRTNFDGYIYYNKEYKSLYLHDVRTNFGYTDIYDSLFGLYNLQSTDQHAMSTMDGKYYIGENYLEPDREVSKSEYDNFCKKYFSNVTKYEMIKNTAANRAKTFS